MVMQAQVILTPILFFLDEANGDFRLSSFSPAIGAGTSVGAPGTDINGNPRPVPTGSNPDMGAMKP